MTDNMSGWTDSKRRGGKRCSQLCLMYGKVIVLILAYYCFSIGLTFFQKHLFKSFPFPLTVVIIHLMIKFLMAGVSRYIMSCYTKTPRTTVAWGNYYARVLPAGAAAGLDIGLSQWSLEYITVTLYTMSKSTALLFILFFAILFKLEEKRWSMVVLIVLIAGGLCMFTYKYTKFHLYGFTLVMTASALSGVRWTLSQLLMQKSDLGLTHPVDLVYHVQPWMALSLLPLAAVSEGESLLTSDVGFNFKAFSDVSMIWSQVLLGAVIAFFMEMSEYYLVSNTSSLTFSISGVAKEIVTLSISISIYNEHLSLINILGLLLCLVGISLHVFFKFRDSTQKGNSSLNGGEVTRRLSSDGFEPLLFSDSEEGEDIEMFRR